MKVFLDAIGGHPLADTVRTLASAGRRHELVAAPDDADLVLLVGSFAHRPELLLDHPLYRRFPGSCAVYTGDDNYLPLAPGVYCAPRRGTSTALGRVRSHAYASAYGRFANPAVQEAAGRLAPDGTAKRHLFSFVGAPTSTLRRHILERFAPDPAALVLDSSSSYHHFEGAGPSSVVGAAGRDRYVSAALASHFVLCPRGAGTGSLRLFETMSLGVAPVLVSDAYVLPRGPDWDAFLLRVPERRLAGIPRVLAEALSSSLERGRAARVAWEQWFSPERIFDGIVDAAREALSADARTGRLYRRATALLVTERRLRTAAARTAVAVRRSRRR